MRAKNLLKAAAVIAAVVVVGLLMAQGTDQARAASAIRPTIDLIPERVWVNADCKVAVRLVRKGKGKLSSKLGGSTILRIYVDKRSYDYTFKEVDPKAKLLNGPGAVNFISPVRIRGTHLVRAVVDPLGLVRESGEGRLNRASTAKIPSRCLVAGAHDAILGALKIKKVYLKGKTLRVVVLGKKGVSLSSKQMASISLRVRAQRISGSWPMSRVMALGKLKKPRELHFNTKLAVAPGAKVKVALVRAADKKVADFTLPASAVSAVADRKARRMHRRFTLPPAAMSPMVLRAKYRKGGSGGVPKMLDMGIRLTLPAGERRYDPGDSFFLTVHVPTGYPSDYITFQVYRGRERAHFVLNSQTIWYDSNAITRTYRVTIPEHVSGGPNYYVMARLSDEVWGLSGMFEVAGPVDWGPAADAPDFEIQVTAPNRAMGTVVNWAIDSTHTISWRVVGEYRGDPRFEVTLEQQGARVLNINSASARYHANSRTYTLDWTIPESVEPGSLYKIRVRDYNSSRQDVSEDPFTITRAHDLIINWPPPTVDRPINVRMGETYVIRWTPVGNVADRPLYINLNGPGYVRRLADVARGSRRQFVWNFGFNCTGRDWVPPGNGYSIRLITDRADPMRVATSANFQVIVPRLTYLNSGPRWTWTRGDRRAIRWSARDMPEGKRVRIVLMKGDESYMDIAPMVMASAGMFIWSVGMSSGTDFTSNMGGPGQPPPGCDYRIRITMTDCHQVVTYSNYFCLD